MQYLLRKATDSKQSHTKRETLKVATGHRSEGCSSSLELTLHHKLPEVQNTDLQGLMFALWGFGVVIGPAEF